MLRFRETAMFAMLIPASPTAEPSDHSEPIVVHHKEHERLEFDLDLVALNSDEPRNVIDSNRGRRNSDLFCLGHGRDCDQDREVW